MNGEKFYKLVISSSGPKNAVRKNAPFNELTMHAYKQEENTGWEGTQRMGEKEKRINEHQYIFSRTLNAKTEKNTATKHKTSIEMTNANDQFYSTILSPVWRQ